MNCSTYSDALLAHTMLNFLIIRSVAVGKCVYLTKSTIRCIYSNAQNANYLLTTAEDPYQINV